MLNWEYKDNDRVNNKLEIWNFFYFPWLVKLMLFELWPVLQFVGWWKISNLKRSQLCTMLQTSKSRTNRLRTQSRSKADLGSVKSRDAKWKIVTKIQASAFFTKSPVLFLEHFQVEIKISFPRSIASTLRQHWEGNHF